MNTLHKRINYNSEDLEIIEKDRVRESFIHDLVLKNSTIQEEIKRILGFENNDVLELIHEDKYINGITADFTLLMNSTIRAIIECKSGDIGVTDYVRGIGQVFQYEYFYEENIGKGRQYNSNFNTILLFPSSIIQNNIFNLGRFKYPKSTLILEINDVNKATREITKSELLTIGRSYDNNLISISQYYIRDNRLFEIYLLLKFLCFLKLKGNNNINRRDIEFKFLRKLNTPNNNNWRNAFITLSSLGFIDSNNIPTKSGIKFGNLDFDEFALMCYKAYIKPFLDTLVEYFSENNERLNYSNIQICDEIKSIYDNKDILFLTESNGRYISSWLNILRDDYGVLDYLPRSKERVLNYKINQLNDENIKNSINLMGKSKYFINKFELLVK